MANDRPINNLEWSLRGQPPYLQLVATVTVEDEQYEITLPNVATVNHIVEASEQRQAAIPAVQAGIDNMFRYFDQTGEVAARERQRQEQERQAQLQQQWAER